MIDKFKRYCDEIIYIAGHSRGGTTFLGDLLSKSDEVNYLFEPFSSSFNYYTGYDTQTLFNNGRELLLGKKKKIIENIFEDFEVNPEKIKAVDLNFYRLIIINHIINICKTLNLPKKKYLLIKQPRIENLRLVYVTLKPDHCVLIDRGIFGILNSFNRGNFYNWTNVEWPLIGRHIKINRSELNSAYENCNTKYRKVILLSIIRKLMIHDLKKQFENIIIINYEDLLENFSNSLKPLCEQIGFKNYHSIHQYYNGLTQIKKHHQDGMLDTNQNPKLKIASWRKELPLKIQSDILCFGETNKILKNFISKEYKALSTSEKRKNNFYTTKQILIKKWELLNLFFHKIIR